MKTYLVPVDFSAVSGRIVEAGVGFARAFGGKVVLLHVVPPPIITSEYALPLGAVQEMVETSEQAAETRLGQLAKDCVAADLEVEPLVRSGPPVATILATAAKVHADYIIMGSHGHGKIYDLLVGSTTSGVIKGARCGVVILPSDQRA
jgi:nucleotide-binding universal stress UspA family protein